MGAKNVLISRGKDGVLLVTEDNKVYISNVGKGKVINSVGAGDSMVLGFIGEYMLSNNFRLELKGGSACGSATAFSSDLAKRDFIDKILEQIVVDEIKLF